eukprot:CAMPEP_0115730054 /NCGR_PEP_ID=MMETSP0272-20121206/83839_1 /TAXON_ID=71861 /ORGANISM="Scrippsiella trochoidea, Strain CCMP3099" /LENGTH=86 /DNA_ID=CAMNT_0003173783 /DNA_START=149 /DNA_END=409 /DNA_ORIENTATION=-
MPRGDAATTSDCEFLTMSSDNHSLWQGLRKDLGRFTFSLSLVCPGLANCCQVSVFTIAAIWADEEASADENRKDRDEPSNPNAPRW